MFTNKALKKLILPLFLDQILIFSVTIIATMMLSYAGEAAVSGVSLVDMINMLLINVLAALAVGGAVVVSQYIGRKDTGNACLAASQLITITAMISMGILLFVIFLHKPTLKVLFGNVEPKVMATAITYFIISGISYPFLAVYNSCAALFRSMGNSKVPMINSILMNMFSIFGSAIAIFWLKTGVAGVATATLLARALAAVIMVYLSLNRKNDVFISFHQIFSWDGKMIRRILNIAIPNGIENGIVQLGRVLLISIIAKFGTTQIAANGVTNGLVGIPISFATAMNLAIVTVVGQCVGANDYGQAVFYTKKLLKLTYAGTIAISVLQLLLLNPILDLYTLSSGTRHLAFILVAIHNGLAILLWPISFTLPSGLRAAGDVRFTMLFSIGSMFIFRLTFAYILGIGFHLGAIGIWLAMGIDWIVRSGVYSVRFRSGRWKSFRVV